MKFFKHYIDQNFHLSNAISEYQKEDPKFNLKKFRDLMKKDKQFRDRFDEVKQLEQDIIKESLRKLSVGIPITDNAGQIIGWQEKPDLKAIEEYIYKLENFKP